MHASILYDGVGLDRAATLRKDAGRLAALNVAPQSRFLPYWRGLSFIHDGPRAGWLEAGAAAPLLAQSSECVFLGVVGDIGYFGLDLSPVEGGEKGPSLGCGEFRSLRSLGPQLPSFEAGLLSYTRGLLHWHSRHRHCAACGSPTRSADGGHIRQCSSATCGTQHFPRTDPAVIMLVTDRDRCLLGRQPSWPAGLYSCLAGFVEPGETLESAVIREVLEEAGVEIAAPRYHASQPWPFPASLMIGFTATAIGGTPRADGVELEDVGWFSRADLRAFPDHGRSFPGGDTIACRLITAWLEDI